LEGIPGSEKMITPKFVYGLIFRISLGITGKINDEKYEFSQSRSCIIVDFPDRKTDGRVHGNRSGSGCICICIKATGETWDKERKK